MACDDGNIRVTVREIGIWVSSTLSPDQVRKLYLFLAENYKPESPRKKPEIKCGATAYFDKDGNLVPVVNAQEIVNEEVKAAGEAATKVLRDFATACDKIFAKPSPDFFAMTDAYKPKVKIDQSLVGTSWRHRSELSIIRFVGADLIVAEFQNREMVVTHDFFINHFTRFK